MIKQIVTHAGYVHAEVDTVKKSFRFGTMAAGQWFPLLFMTVDEFIKRWMDVDKALRIWNPPKAPSNKRGCNCDMITLITSGCQCGGI